MSISIANNNISSSGTLTLNNKALSNVAFSGSYNDLTDKPSISGGIQSSNTVQVINLNSSNVNGDQIGVVVLYTTPADGFIKLTTCKIQSGGRYTSGLDVFGLFNISAYYSTSDLLTNLHVPELYLFVRKGSTIKSTGSSYVGFPTITGYFFGVE